MTKVINYLFSKNVVESNLVYPRERGYKYIAKLDREWVESKLMGRRIANKYCVVVKSNGEELLVTNHDGKYFLTIKE